jgi:transmembrane sensor
LIDIDSRLAQGPLRVRSIWSADRPERVARQILRRRRLFFALDAALACACAVMLFIGVRGGVRGGAGAVAAQQAPSASVAVPTAKFQDGSVAELMGRDTDLRVEQDTPHRVVAKLTGGARFRVVPNRQRTFEVQSGDVRVRVLGTTFSVVQLPSGPTQVLVEEGHVQVAWLGGAAELQAGEGGVFPPSDAGAIEPSPAAASLDDVQSVPLTAAAAVASGARSVASHRGWRDYALKGDYARAYDELNANGHEGVRDEAADLMLAADVARLSGHPEQALQPLRSLCDRHGGDKRAPVAAFTLGRVLIDDLGRPADAATAFQRARVLWPRGPLAEDALAREADAWQRAGRPERARTIAEQYLARYPQGRHADAMRNILAP